MNLGILGFSAYDLALIFFCPICAAVGSFAYAIVDTLSEEMPRSEDDFKLATKRIATARGAWLGLRLILSAILGFVLGLYFVGAIQETPSTLAKILALAVLVGYAAPKIWIAQARLVEAKIQNHNDLNEVSDSSN